MSTPFPNYCMRVRVRCGWLPARATGYCRLIGGMAEVGLTTLLVHESFGPGFKVFAMTDLMQTLLIEVLNFTEHAEDSVREHMILDLLSREIGTAAALSYAVAMPQSDRLAEICSEISRDLSQVPSLAKIAERLASTPRTVARQFQRELGMNYSEWLDVSQMTFASAQLEQGFRQRSSHWIWVIRQAPFRR